ncbi:dicarboxylate/amino acid:cation symporter [Alginatibacterium sediminis]|uniref:Dicarboxylate/amino acid:cation symporter n=1 Tax=Alginatibacterium sediminis TaxID=2164068 RepID=A0A420E882_9ALTE|nr:dicarboxylate/amino acid:cation symporter [Alginatibacterium sediminis]RKF15615.1 dicarboxylate/amino acid:cation symporter [Alginatibacterium sediminis]
MPSSNKKLTLTHRILIGMVSGILLGTVLQMLSGSSLFIQHYLIDGLFHIGGSIFVASLKMLVVPLVFVSLVCGVSSMKDTARLGRLGGKTLLLYLVTTAIAISLAMAVALLIRPGTGMELAADVTFNAKEAPSLSQVVIDLFPSNPIESMAKGNMLQIIVFSLLFGISLAITGDAGKRVASFFQDLNEVIMKLVTLLMNVAPYGVFCLLAKLFYQMGFDAIASLFSYFMVVLSVLLIHALVVYPLILRTLGGLNPFIFLRKMREAIVFAFSTASSNATIPVTMETATHKLGVRNSTASFTVPLGATINMDGTSIMQGVATIFIATVYGIDLSAGDFLMVIVTATLASVGTAGVPGVGLITLAMVLQQVGLPVEGIALIIGVDRLLDMVRTAVNITGDSMVTTVVAKSEGDLDLEVYNNKDAGLKDEQVELPHEHA